MQELSNRKSHSLCGLSLLNRYFYMNKQQTDKTFQLTTVTKHIDSDTESTLLLSCKRFIEQE
jgi:hypothetical protein